MFFVYWLGFFLSVDNNPYITKAIKKETRALPSAAGKKKNQKTFPLQNNSLVENSYTNLDMQIALGRLFLHTDLSRIPRRKELY